MTLGRHRSGVNRRRHAPVRFGGVGIDAERIAGCADDPGGASAHPLGQRDPQGFCVLTCLVAEGVGVVAAGHVVVQTRLGKLQKVDQCGDL